jgi:ABC-type multidrug transport system fused ATPase/permease subunit
MELSNSYNSFSYLLKIYQRNIGSGLYSVVVLSLMTSLSEGIGIAMLLPLLNVLDKNNIPAEGLELLLYNALEVLGIGSSLFSILFIILLLFVTKGILTFVQSSYTGYLLSVLSKELKERMYDALVHADYNYYIKQNTGHYINIFNDQINTFSLSFNRFTAFLSSTIMTIGYFGMSLIVSWRFALMAIIAGMVFIIMFRKLNEYVRTLSRKSSSEMSELNKILVQVLQARKYITSTNQNEHLRKVAFMSNRRLQDYSFKSWMAVAVTGSVKEPISIIFIVAIVLVQVSIFEGTVSAIFVMILLFYRTLGSTISIQTSWQGVMSMVGSVELVNQEFLLLEQNQEVGGTKILTELSHSIELKNLSFCYDKEQEYILKQVNISIPANMTTAVVGPSGAGKSTLVDLLTLLLKPQAGTIYIDGVNSQDVKLSSWRSRIGYVSQETVVFDDTIYNNICMWQGDTTFDHELMGRIKTAARQARIMDFIEKLPDGFQTLVGDRGVLLSGGQRQRLFIARELFKNPSLLILDEATSSLDTESEKKIQESIDSLKGCMTIVIIAHRLSTIRNSDKIYVLEQGRVIEAGTYKELYTNSKSKLAKMVAIQAL